MLYLAFGTCMTVLELVDVLGMLHLPVFRICEVQLMLLPNFSAVTFVFILVMGVEFGVHMYFQHDQGLTILTWY